MHRLPIVVLTVLLLLTSGSTGQAATARRQIEREAPFVPGQVLVRLKPDAATTPTTITAAIERHGARTLRHLTDEILLAMAQAGGERTLVKRLLADSAVEHASLNYLLVTQPVEVEPWRKKVAAFPAAPDQEVESCVTDVWLSASREGERILENMVPWGTAEIYVFFEYTGCEFERARVQVFYFDSDGPPVQVFNREDFVIDGSFVQGVQVPAWEGFEVGMFSVGQYETKVYLSPEGGWDEVASDPWRVTTFPNDPYFRGTSNRQWPLHSTGSGEFREADIDAPQAWDITTGSDQLLIAIVSTGIAIDHPDLVHKIWTNRREIPNNGVDDDENGCPDDVNGCAFRDGVATSEPMDTRAWGTLSGGIAAAHTNNEIGVAGVAWGPTLLPVKFLWGRADGQIVGQVADLIAGIDYALRNGARVIDLGGRVAAENVSSDALELLRSVIDDAVGQGALVISGTGDDGEEDVKYPARFENVVAVGATNIQAQRAWFSNYGPEVDLVAPGHFVWGPYRDDRSPSTDYAAMHGTTLAAAHVDGVAALVWSVDPTLSPAEVRTILQESARAPGRQRYGNQDDLRLLNAANAVSQTAHRLWLKTDHVDELSLLYLMDDTTSEVCKPVWNLGTTLPTWRIEASDPWIKVVKPAGDASAARVPSRITVCIDQPALPGTGVFETNVVASSNLVRKHGPVTIPMRVVNLSALSRVSLPLLAAGD